MTDNWERTYGEPEDGCEHVSIGLAIDSETWRLVRVCNDCDETLGDAECQHDEVARHYDRFGTTTWQCEDCGATTMETDVDEDEDGRGKRETPLWA
jgi:hypothetical protein